MTIDSVSEVVIRSESPLQTTAFLTTFGGAVETLPPIPHELAHAWYGATRELRQLRVATPGSTGAVRVVESTSSLRRLTPFTEGGYGIDYYTSDVHLASRMAARRGHLPAPPLAWQEDDQELIEARLEDPSATYAVFLPQMERTSRLHPSLLDADPHRMYSELCMTSWIIPRENRDAECAFWTEQLGLTVVIDTEMDGKDMGTLMGHAPEPLHSVQFALQGSPCLVDLLSYGEGRITPADTNMSAVAAIALGASRDVAARINPHTRPMQADRGRGSEYVTRTTSPSGIPLEIWSAA